MFASRKQLQALHRELQHARLVMDGLRRDVNRCKKQLRDLNGWGDDFIKTQEVPETETRAFIRESWPGGDPDPVVPGEVDDAIPAPEAEAPRSWVRRRFA